MKVKPKENYSLLGTAVVLDNTKVYTASHASNIPDWKEKGLIFVHESEDEDCAAILLESGEYEVV
jgi:hypothetical protein